MTIDNSENLGTTTGTTPLVFQVDANGTQSTPGIIPVMDHNHRLYLQSTDKENFREEFWYQWEMCNAIVQSWIMNTVSSNLLGGMVYADNAQDIWEDLKERFNKVDRSRSFSLHQEIVRLTLGTTFVATYFEKLKELWVELEA
uniref:Uncharacterized protein LOC104238690 n=1 Tax=Nicotiana sylvestris TaxID=4096 RepID=A0A1U7XHA0_NICSY|nr:PREDICTED: uncharacterized protein LOC104238690 [Nicotiana sylvestris]